MDSKPNTRTGIPQAEMPEIRFDDGKLRRTNRWLVGAVVVLALALVAVGTWAIVDRSGGEETAAPAPTQPPMPSATAELMDGFSAAVNEGNAAGAAALFTEEGVLRLADGTVVEGRQEIEEFLDGVSGVEFQQIGDLVIYGNLVTGIYEYRLTDGSPGSAQALARSMVIRNGQILSVTDAATPPPDESA